MIAAVRCPALALCCDGVLLRRLEGAVESAESFVCTECQRRWSAAEVGWLRAANAARRGALVKGGGGDAR